MTNIFSKRVLNKFAKQVPELEQALRKAKMKFEPTLQSPFEMLVRPSACVGGHIMSSSLAEYYQSFDNHKVWEEKLKEEKTPLPTGWLNTGAASNVFTSFFD